MAPTRNDAASGAAKEVPPASATTLVEFTAQETEQNHRVITAVKKLDENSGSIGHTKSISSLRLKDCVGKSEEDKACAAAKQGLNTTPKGEGSLPVQYDVLLPGGKPIGGLIPWTAQYNTKR